MYTHTTLHKLPHLSSGTATLDITYYGAIYNNVYVSLVSTSLNSGDPCGKASVAAGGGGTAQTGKYRAGVSDKDVSFPRSVVNTLDASHTYTLCYSESNHLAIDPAYSGMGHPPFGWRDSYIRFTITQTGRRPQLLPALAE
jgi:hypothetical protein